MRSFGSMLTSDVLDYSRYDHVHDDLYNDLSIDFYEGHPSNYAGGIDHINYEFKGYPILRS